MDAEMTFTISLFVIAQWAVKTRIIENESGKILKDQKNRFHRFSNNILIRIKCYRNQRNRYDQKIKYLFFSLIIFSKAFSITYAFTAHWAITNKEMAVFLELRSYWPKLWKNINLSKHNLILGHNFVKLEYFLFNPKMLPFLWYLALS